ncbi:MAG: phosphoribosyltransferase family protein, partial [Pseudomonadota bacterium]
MEKHFASEAQTILDGFRLGTQIYASGFRPSFIVGVWRGGASVGIVVQECLATFGVETDHIALRTSYQSREEYESTARSGRAIRVHGKQYLLETMNRDDRLLIVDDVYSSGRHTRAVISALEQGLKRNMPEQVRVASLWYRSDESGEQNKPDYFVHATQDWIVLPFEVASLS